MRAVLNRVRTPSVALDEGRLCSSLCTEGEKGAACKGVVLSSRTALRAVQREDKDDR